MIKDKKFLFVFRLKLSNVEYTWKKNKKKHIDKDYDEEYRKQKPVQSGWMDAIDKKCLINNLSFSLGFLAYALPYNIFLSILKASKTLRIFDALDSFILNSLILKRMIIENCEVLYYYNKDVYRITEWILIQNKKMVIQYDGVPNRVRIGSLKKEILPKGKILCSNMDWTSEIGKNRENFKVIRLGVNEAVLKFNNAGLKSIDVFIAGGVDNNVWSRRAEYFEYLLANKQDILVKIAGKYVEGAKYPRLNDLKMTKIYGDEFNWSLSNAKITVVIISDEHDKMGNGMPMRFYENALFEVLQLVYKTNAYQNTILEDGIDFVTFGTKDEMMKKIRHYLSNEKERKKIVKSAKNKVIRNYTTKQCFIEFLQGLE